MVRIGIYTRVSTQEQAKEGYSIGEQEERLKLYCEAHNWQVIKVYVDAGHTGSNTNRPALQDLIADVKAGMLDKVLVYKLDRLSRSQKDTLELIEDVFLKNNCDFESMTEKFDTGTSFGKAMIGILAVFAQLEREQIKERLKLGMEARTKEGKWKGGYRTPFGYDYNKDTGLLTVNPYNSIIVKELFSEFLSGKSLRSISREFEAKGFTLSNGKCGTRAFRYIMSNKTYCGYLKSKGTWIKGIHEPIIDEETYNEANKILDRNRNADYAKNSHNYGNKNYSTYLGGMIFCAHCGAKYGKTMLGHKQYGYKPIYSCYSRSKKMSAMVIDPNCKNKNYDAAVLDKMIFDEVRKLALDPDYVFKNKPSDDGQAIKAITQKITNIDLQLSRLIDLYSLGKFDIGELDKRTSALSDQKLKLQEELKRLDAEKKLTKDEVIIAVKSFDDVLKHGTMDQVRTILSQLINRIEIDNEDITIYWNFN